MREILLLGGKIWHQPVLNGEEIMGYRVSGILKLPDGTPANNAEIEYISRKNFSPLVQELKSNIRCSATGAYDVTLEYGEYAVIVYPGGTYPAALGTIILAADTVAGQDLPTLLQQAGWQPATPEYIQQIAAWLADANASAARAANSAASASAAVLDAERRSLERATGGMQTIIYDGAGNANAMFVLPRFRYEDLGMTAAMGSGDVTAFDFGAGSIKGEIFIGAYLASGSGAVSAPRQDPRASLDHTAARAACAAKGAGWHLMTAHEWAAIALWCTANGYEPIGNTNWGRSHAQTRMVGDRADNRAPGDAAGTGRTQTGSMGSEATHTRTLGGIADLVGNVWEWQDGFLLMDGRFKLSSFNTQAEASWAFVDAYLDSTSTTGGAPVLSHAVTNRLGTAGDSANSGYSANADWKSMTKSSGYVSNQLMRRLLLEPATTLPQGRIYMRNFGERLPIRGGTWNYGANAGLAAVALDFSRAAANTYLGFRPAFA